MTTETLKLDAGKLYLIAGLPSSGKSSFLKENKIPKEMVVSTDDIRSDFFGTSFQLSEDGNIISSPISSMDATGTWAIAEIALENRLRQGLTTFFDAASLVAAGDREHFANIALKYGVETVTLFLDVDPQLCIERDKKREAKVGELVITKFFDKFESQGGLAQLKKEPHHLVNMNTKISLTPNTLPHENYDIIGDVHGLYDDFIQLINTMGYVEDKNGVFRHPDNRNLFLLGDFLDRGTQSIEMLRFAYKQSLHTDDKFIIGNHENKLLTFLTFKNEKGKIIKPSPSAGLTAADFIRLPEKEQKVLHAFLLKLPKYFVFKNIAFGHANIEYFNPLTTPSSYLMYSDEHKSSAKYRQQNKNNPDIDIPRVNQDRNYSKLFEKGINQYYYVRGHIQSQDKTQKHVLALDNKQAFDGHFLSVKLEDLQTSIKQGLGVNNPEIIQSFKTISRFDFRDYEKEKLGLYKKIMNLVKQKLAQTSNDESGLLTVFKYKKDVFFKRKWEEEHDLLSCRGIVFDFAGNIVQYPFDKVFNYNEPNEKGLPTGHNIDNDIAVEWVEKLNGFLGNITKHPFKHDLLLSTTGSLTSPFVDYIMDMIKHDGVYGDLMRYTNQHPNKTLMFEVIHPEDPHIVKYDESEMGLYLIGGREKTINSPLFSEQELDEIALEIGLKRPSWGVKTLQECINDMSTVDHEGYMIRDVESKEILLKLKSVAYLSTKFFARLSANKTKFMFSNPKAFKKNIDEEFFPIVDELTSRYTEEDFSALSKEERLTLAQALILDNYKKPEIGVEKKRKVKP